MLTVNCGSHADCCIDLFIFNNTTVSLRGCSKCRIQGTQLCSGITGSKMPVDF